MTARDDFDSKRRGFKLGIDDYMVKPVNLDELVLRVQALLRRAGIAQSKMLLSELRQTRESSARKTLGSGLR
jgi:DNA-binding response OmpR family regulator